MSKNEHEVTYEISSLRPIQESANDIGHGWDNTTEDKASKEEKVGRDSKDNR